MKTILAISAIVVFSLIGSSAQSQISNGYDGVASPKINKEKLAITNNQIKFLQETRDEEVAKLEKERDAKIVSEKKELETLKKDLAKVTPTHKGPSGIAKVNAKNADSLANKQAEIDNISADYQAKIDTTKAQYDRKIMTLVDLSVDPVGEMNTTNYLSYIKFSGSASKVSRAYFVKKLGDKLEEDTNGTSTAMISGDGVKYGFKGLVVNNTKSNVIVHIAGEGGFKKSYVLVPGQSVEDYLLPGDYTTYSTVKMGIYTKDNETKVFTIDPVQVQNYQGREDLYWFSCCGL
jgi:hypothetical protein